MHTQTTTEASIPRLLLDTLLDATCEVFETMKSHVKSYINDVIDLGKNLNQDRIYEFFPVFIDEQERLLSEDYAFCRKARDIGYKVYAAPWVQLGHFGTYLFEGGLLPAP
mgnify:CR=1 FL=1